MISALRLDVESLLRLFVARQTIQRAVLFALVPLALGALVAGGVLGGGSLIAADFAAVGLFVLPWTLGTVIGITLWEVRSRPLTRLLPTRRRREGRGCAVVGGVASVVCVLGLTPAIPEADLLGGLLLAWSGFGLAVAMCSVPSTLAFLGIQLYVFSQVGMARTVLEEGPFGGPLLFGLAGGATAAFAWSFTVSGRSETPWDSRRARGARHLSASASDSLPAAGASSLDRALATALFEARTSGDRRDATSMFRLALLVVAIGVVGPLIAGIWRVDEPSLRTVLASMHEAFVGRPLDGQEPGDGIAGTSATLAFALSILPFMAAAPFHGGTFRPFSRQTHAWLAYAMWQRTIATGGAVFLATWLAVTFLLGLSIGAPIPHAVPVFAWIAVLLVPLAPWMTLAASAARAAGERRSPAWASCATIGTFALSFSIGGALYAWVRRPEFDPSPSPIAALACLAVLALGIAALRAHHARHFGAAALPPARPSAPDLGGASLRDGREKPAAAPG
ncbi:MAG: hypothetical protein AAGI22_25810 [Planctomycetota bacterium]